MTEIASLQRTTLEGYRKQLRAEERSFRSLIQENADGILLVDQQGIIRFANPAAAIIFGREPGGLIGQDFGLPLTTGEKAEIELLRSGSETATAEMRVAETEWEGRLCHLVSLRDITERKRAEERAAHLNDVLRAIRNVNKLIVREDDQERLIEQACQLLVETRGYHNAWIVLLDEEGRVSSAAEANVGHAFTALLEGFQRGEPPGCARQVLRQPGVLAQEAPANSCTSCPLAEDYSKRGALSISLEHGGKEYGVLTVSTPRRFLAHEEEQNLFAELAADLAFGLYRIELEDRRKALERIVNRSPAVAFIWRAEEGWPVSYVSDNVDQFGYSPEDYYAKQLLFSDVVHPDDLSDVEEEVATYSEEGRTTFTQEYRITTRDGETRWVDDHTWVRRDATGAVTSYEGIVLDITGRKRAEEALRWRMDVERAAAELSRALLRSASIEEISTIVLEHAKRLTASEFGYVGYIEPETGHLVCPTMTGEIWDECGVQNKDTVFEEFGGLWGWVLEHGEPILTNEPAADTRSSGVPAGHLPIKRFLSVPAVVGEELVGQIALANPDRDYSARDMRIVERLAGLYALAVERDRALEALRHSEHRYRTLFDHAGDAIFVHSPEGDFYDVNQVAADTLNYTREELLSLSLPDIVSPADVAKIEARVGQLPEKGHIVFEASHVTREGETIPVEVNSQHIQYDGVPAILSIARDITERREAKRKIERYAADLKRSNQELEQFAYAVSHDLQEPLRMVGSYLELLDVRYRDELDAKADKFIGYALEGVERMRDMIRALLDLSRVETRGRDFSPTDCDEVFDRTLRTLQTVIEQTEGRVTRDPLPTVMADRSQLSQVFQNLIANALKYHRPGVPPRVHVSASRSSPDDGGDADEVWVFSVEDNGIGIARHQIDRIFKVFQRLHTDAEYPGLGIGLALCKRIVERHGGRVWVESEPGRGSTFFFTIPV